jgi:hypothetical protein
MDIPCFLMGEGKEPDDGHMIHKLSPFGSKIQTFQKIPDIVYPDRIIPAIEHRCFFQRKNSCESAGG